MFFKLLDNNQLIPISISMAIDIGQFAFNNKNIYEYYFNKSIL